MGEIDRMCFRPIVHWADDVDETEAGRADDEGPGTEDEADANRANESEGLNQWLVSVNKASTLTVPA